MIEDFTGDDDEDESEEEEDESISESVESTTTRFGRFISPLAFSKISETLGFIMFQNLSLLASWNCRKCRHQRNINSIGKMFYVAFRHAFSFDLHSCYSLIYPWIIEINSISLRNSISNFKLIQLCRSSRFMPWWKSSVWGWNADIIFVVHRSTQYGGSIHCEHDTRTRSINYQ